MTVIPKLNSSELWEVLWGNCDGCGFQLETLALHDNFYRPFWGLANALIVETFSPKPAETFPLPISYSTFSSLLFIEIDLRHMNLKKYVELLYLSMQHFQIINMCHVDRILQSD